VQANEVCNRRQPAERHQHGHQIEPLAALPTNGGIAFRVDPLHVALQIHRYKPLDQRFPPGFPHRPRAPSAEGRRSLDRRLRHVDVLGRRLPQRVFPM
jgi:hypothetical protein